MARGESAPVWFDRPRPLMRTESGVGASLDREAAVWYL